jgi:3-phenylpropionate/cinnamic acid dioxygenase small subunit
MTRRTVPVEDVIAIQQLLAEYGHVVDARDWLRFRELFVTDARLDYTRAGADEVFTDVESITSWFERANHPSAHHVVNIFVFEQDAQVRVKSKFFAPYTRETHAPKRWYGGDYDDIVVSTPDGWRFRSRTCSGRWLYTVDEGPIPEHRRTW